MPRVIDIARDIEESRAMLRSIGMTDKQSSTKAKSGKPHRGLHHEPTHPAPKPIAKPHHQDKPAARAPNQRGEGKRELVCYNCGETGHPSFKCPRDRATCPVCKKQGHLEKFCRFKSPVNGAKCLFSAASGGGSLPVVNGVIEKAEVKVLLDSGADCATISPDLCSSPAVTRINHDTVRIQTAGGIREAEGTVSVQITLRPSPFTPRGCELKIRAFVLKTAYEVSFGYSQMVEIGLLPSCSQFWYLFWNK
ncbi:hypothetical protein J8273_5862 [Carpediemonas membranifera]|uniref:CCHC-type domain-containing protein n=1 Tax=Carpediemonas membranifera TaxID=201153 RepID=A0A8J6E0W3_9EUKA|nr:hypothetical protein J8273_5862 [Carpediemonas membranifera]|eukprot:KAG9392723.1 hypothetical protein J8273_5862 [Carpediemonas membranifera]